LILISCGQIRLANELKAKGYNTQKDTVNIMPYDWVIIEKGYAAWTGSCEHTSELDIKISVKHYEEKDSISINEIRDGSPLEFILSDTSYQVIGGRFYAWFGGGGVYYDFKAKETKIPSNWISKRYKCSNGDILFFQCIRVQKNGNSYAIPNRKYWLF
jgi:hypothetical protein